MSKLGTARINIGANLSPLHKDMKNARALIVKNISKMSKTAFKGIGNLATSFIKKVTKAVKYATAAIAGFVATSIWAASRQENAEVKLAAALKSTKQYTDETMESLKDYARELQNVTTVGDETSLAMMQLALTYGAEIKRVPHVVKGAIAIAKAKDMEALSLVRYLALAEKGEYTMLQRYIPALRFAANETEKMAILNKVIAESMEIAEAETWTFSGALMQMRNAMGDAMERFGGPFLKTFTLVFKHLKQWFEDNGDVFEQWGQRFNAVMIEVSRHLMWILNTVKNGDWESLKQYLLNMWDWVKGGLISVFSMLEPHALKIGQLIGMGITEGLKMAGKAAVEGMTTGQQYGAAMGGGALLGAKVAGPAGAAVGAGVGAVGVGAYGVSREAKAIDKAVYDLVDALKENNRLQKLAKQRGVAL